MQQFFKDVLTLIDHQTGKLVYFSGLSTISAFLDVVGIGLVGPLVLLMINPHALDNIAIWQSFMDTFGISSYREALIVLSLGILIAFYLKGIISYWIEHAIFSFAYNAQRFLINKFLHLYQNAPYEFHLQSNSAQLQNVLHIHTDNFMRLSLMPLLRLGSSIVIVGAILALLAFTELPAMLVLGVMLGAVILFYYKVIKTRSYRCGQESSLAKGKAIKHINHCLGGLKEIKILGREEYFFSELDKESKIYAGYMAEARSLEVIPRYLIECVLVTFVLGFACFVLWTGGGSANLMAVLSVFGAAAARLLPATNIIGKSIAELRQSKFYVDYLINDLSKLENVSREPESIHLDAKKIEFQSLEMRDIDFYYPNTESPALSKVNLTISKGDTVGIIGKSGSGKSTLVNVMLGFLKPQTGSILFNKQDLSGTLTQWQNCCAYIPQNIYLLDDTVCRNVAIGVSDDEIDMNRLNHAIDASQLREFVNTLPDGMHTLIGEEGVRLSGGQRQRIGIARALYFEREVLIMDEATSALDNETEQAVIRAIDFLKGTVTLVVIAHRYSTIRQCDTIYKFDQGRMIASGDYETLGLSAA